MKTINEVDGNARRRWRRPAENEMEEILNRVWEDTGLEMKRTDCVRGRMLERSKAGRR
jgi:hypothetical protein